LKKSKFTEAQVVTALRQVDAGAPIAEVTRALGISEATYYVWRIRPRKPVENAVIESFNGRLRDECLNANVFISLHDAKKRLKRSGAIILLPLRLRPPLRHGPARTEEVARASDSAEPIERWTAKRRVSLVVSILKGETSVAEAARTHGLTVAEVEEWREKFLLGAENALRSRPKDEEAVKDEQIKKLKQKIGDLVLDNDILREALKPYPLDRKTSDA
jgi:transposase-like protein